MFKPQELKQPPNFPVAKDPNGIFLLNRMLHLGYPYFIKDNGDGNQYVNIIWKEILNVVIPFLWVNPKSKDHLDNLENNIRNCYSRGIKIHQCWETFDLGSNSFHQIMEVAASHKLPIFIHLYSKNDARILCKIIKENSKVNIIIAHMLGLDILQEIARTSEGLYFDTSGSERVRREDILFAVNEFGYERIIFGTDTPYADISKQMEKINQLKLKGNEMDCIFGKNIQSLLSVV